MSRILTIIFFIISGIVTSGEAGDGKEIEGILITASCDTLKGFIKKTPEKRLFKYIKFRSTTEQEYKTYRPEHIEEFISDKFNLLSHRVVLNNVGQYIFIKKIYDGGLDLYYSWVEDSHDIINNSNELYFIGFDDERIMQIHQRLLIQTLTVIFSNCDCVLEKINSRKFDYYYYNYNRLLSFFTTYDECRNPDIALSNRNKKYKAFNP
jgi:hypothetical protein